MATVGGYSRHHFLDELNAPLDTQEGVLSPASQKARVRANIGLVDGTLVMGDTFTVATAPAAASNTNRVIIVTNGAAGNATLAYSDGTNWKRLDGAGGNISAT